MRVAIRGRRTLGEVRAHLNQVLDRLESLGATHTQGANLYVNLYTEEGLQFVAVSGDGEEVEILEIPLSWRTQPEESRATPTQASGNVVLFPRR